MNCRLPKSLSALMTLIARERHSLTTLILLRSALPESMHAWRVLLLLSRGMRGYWWTRAFQWGDRSAWDGALAGGLYMLEAFAPLGVPRESYFVFPYTFF